MEFDERASSPSVPRWGSDWVARCHGRLPVASGSELLGGRGDLADDGIRPGEHGVRAGQDRGAGRGQRSLAAPRERRARRRGRDGVPASQRVERRGRLRLAVGHDGRDTVDAGAVLYVLDGIPAAYDADDGSGRWRQADVAGCVGAPRLTEDGVFGVTTGRNYARDVPTVFRLHAGNGGVDWRTDLPVDPSYTPVVADETVVTAGERRSPDGGVVAAHSASGAERWRVELEGLLWAEPTIGDGAVFVATRDGTVTALDLDTGDVRGQRTFASAPRRFCYGEGQLYAFTGVLRGLSAASGRTAWRTNLGGDPVGVDAEAIYCVGGRGLSADRYLRVVDRETRTQRWHYEFPEVLRGDIQTGGIVGRPALVDGAVFVAAADGLYAFEADSPLDV